VSNWRIRRLRPAPTDARTASSCWRAVPRARSRIETFAQPIDQQREDRAEQQHQRPRKFTQYFFIQRDDGSPTVLRVALVVFGELIGDGLEFRRSGGKLYVGLQLYKSHPIVVRIGRGCRGQVHVAIAPGKARRHNTDNAVELVIELNVFSYYIAIPAKLALPKQVTEHRNRCDVCHSARRR